MIVTATDFQTWAAAGHERTEAFLQRVLPAPEIAPQRLHAAMRYAVLGGGKRVLGQAAKYAAERHQFNRPIASFGAIKYKLAEMLARIYAGAEHPHTAQQPEFVDFKAMNRKNSKTA